MSTPPDIQTPSDPGRLPMTLPLLMEKKRLSDPIVMVTAYDYPSARAAEAADILEHEQVHVLDIDNGARFETYTIAGERGSGAMKVNGAAARLVHHADTIIVISYAHYDRSELELYQPRVVHVEANTNRIVTIDDEVATLLA